MIIIYSDIDEVLPDEDEAKAHATLKKVIPNKRKVHVMEDDE